jgi:hypothetical protein
MNKEFIPYEQALALKELGFDEPCFYMWNIDTKELFSSNNTDINGQPTNLDLIGNVDFTAPLYQQAFRWFRENYELHSTLTSISQESWQYHITKPGESLGTLYDEDYYTYEEAELDCLRKLIEILNQNKDE